MWLSNKAIQRSIEKLKRMSERPPQPWLQVYQAKRRGIKFGKLSPIRMCNISRSGVWLWLCQCDCGEHRQVSSVSLVEKKVTSCGCLCKLNRQKMAMFFVPASCQQCQTQYITNKFRYEGSWKLCPICNHRKRSRLYAQRRRNNKGGEALND